MTPEILPYSTPTGIRPYVPLEDYQRALDNLDKLENENTAMREAIKEAYALVNDVYLEADNYADGAPDAEFYAKLSNNFAHLLKPALTKLQPFLTQPKWQPSPNSNLSSHNPNDPHRIQIHPLRTARA